MISTWLDAPPPAAAGRRAGRKAIGDTEAASISRRASTPPSGRQPLAVGAGDQELAADQ